MMIGMVYFFINNNEQLSSRKENTMPKRSERNITPTASKSGY